MIPDFRRFFNPNEDALSFIADGNMFLKLGKSFSFADSVSWKISKNSIKCTASSIDGKRRASENLTIVKGPEITFNTNIKCLKMFKPQMCTVYISGALLIFITRDNKYKFVTSLLH